MGASDWVIYGVIIEQALWMLVTIFQHGSLLWCRELGRVCNSGIIILITPATAIGVLGVTVLMCWLSHLCDSKGYSCRPSDRI